jgi:hypothetical protein
MHPGSFKPRLYQQLVGTLHTPTAYWPSLRAKLGILHLGRTLLQIGNILPNRWRGFQPAAHFSQEWPWSHLPQLLFLGLHPRLALLADDRFANSLHPFDRMHPIEDADRIDPMQINKALQPLGAIGHRRHLPRRLHAPSMQFSQGQPPKGGGIRQAGEIREPLQTPFWPRLLGFPHDYRFDFGPLPSA